MAADSVSLNAVERAEKSTSSRDATGESAANPAEKAISFAVTGPNPRQTSLIAAANLRSERRRISRRISAGGAVSTFNFSCPGGIS